MRIERCDYNRQAIQTVKISVAATEDKSEWDGSILFV